MFENNCILNRIGFTSKLDRLFACRNQHFASSNVTWSWRSRSASIYHTWMLKGNNGKWYIFLPKFYSMRFKLEYTKVWSQTFDKNICCRLQVESSLAVFKYSCCVELDETISKSCAQEILEIYAWALAVYLWRHSRLYLLVADSDVSCRTCARKCLMNWTRMKIHLGIRVLTHAFVRFCVCSGVFDFLNVSVCVCET